MAQLNFNLDMDILKDSVMNSNIDAVVKSTIVLVLNEYMEMERDEYLKAASYERSVDRIDYRNGYYERDLTMSIGKITLKVPRTRQGDFAPSVFERYARCDQALVLSMLEMVVNGVSTRKVTKIVEQLCGKSVSKSFVSSLTAKLDPVVNEWANRPLNTTYFPYLFVDAMYIKVREHNRVVSKAVYLALGVDKEGRREILGLKVDHNESFKSWSAFFQHLISRGLQSPKLVVSDAHEGLKKAIQQDFVGTSWQRCNVHFKRNIVDAFPKKDNQEAISLLKSIFAAEDMDTLRNLKELFFEKYEGNSKYQKALGILDEGFEDSIQYMNFPIAHRKSIRSTNGVERLNGEIRRRERVIRIFPNTQSAFRLIGAVLISYVDGNKYWNKRLFADKKS
ncbi:IS256 family transposase [Sporosarcina thermotolerans]|uniref:Mutator family transposase n=2 Tax=Sporosarcina thermotolerans TaxID=633404 RepID=A0AAW9ABK9_9BACL|nr:IS256 family transposase [Sporosarcina thermotolerans]MDW0118887.1 IS256 family transposase [Sporosarcina thermotolerans]